MTEPLPVICGLTDHMRDRLSPVFGPVLLAELDDADAWLAENGSQVRQVLTDGHHGVPARIMEALPKLDMISCYGVGYDNIDTGACVERGIVATHTPNVLNAEVATTAILLLLACYRELLRDEAWARSGDWEQHGNAPLTRSVDGQVIGILGMGRIGQEIARKLEPWSPLILYHTRSPKDVPFEHVPDLVEMARRADALIVIVPGGEATRHVVNRDVLEALGPSGTLVNVARGTVVDEAALVEALGSGKLGWAGLDVFEQEPKIPEALKAMPNVVLLPHVGSATVETRRAMGDLAVDNLLSFHKDGSVLTPVPECRKIATRIEKS